MDDVIGGSYWPATLQFSTVYATDVFISFKEMKMASPGLSVQGFLRMLDQRTAYFGRVSVCLIILHFICFYLYGEIFCQIVWQIIVNG